LIIHLFYCWSFYEYMFHLYIISCHINIILLYSFKVSLWFLFIICIYIYNSTSVEIISDNIYMLLYDVYNFIYYLFKCRKDYLLYIFIYVLILIYIYYMYHSSQLYYLYIIFYLFILNNTEC